MGTPVQTKVSGDRQRETTHEICCLAAELFLFWLVSRESGVSFTEAQPGAILTAVCFEIAYLPLRKIL